MNFLTENSMNFIDRHNRNLQGSSEPRATSASATLMIASCIVFALTLSEAQNPIPAFWARFTAVICLPSYVNRSYTQVEEAIRSYNTVYTGR